MQLTINLEGGKPKATDEITIIAPSVEPTTSTIPRTREKSDSLTEVACAAISVGVLLVIAIKPINMAIKSYIHQPVSATSPATKSQPASKEFGLPVPDVKASSEFGMRKNPVDGGYRLHDGIDIPHAQGTPILASRSGKVLSAGTKGGYGLTVVIDHGDGYETLYAHCSELKVSAGQQVNKGDVVGLVGTTGNSTGPHLHFTIKLNGKPVNPREHVNVK